MPAAARVAASAFRCFDCSDGVAPRGRVHHLAAGDFVLLPNAGPHVVRSGPGVPAVPFDDWLALHPLDEAGRAVQPGRGVPTRVIGGFFSSGRSAVHPLVAALPRLIVLRGDDPDVHRWLEPTLAFIENEMATRAQGATAVLARMADVLFIQAVRAYAAHDRNAGGVLRGMSDRRIAQALALLHERYREPWTLDALARATAMSRTALAVRFRQRVGVAPMHYLTQWRIARAERLMLERPRDIEQLAVEVGYASGTVFARAFKRVTGESPGRWRRRRGASR